jgi:hypothetical protein
MSQPPMTGPQSQGLIAQGPLPAGMLRIQQGNQERYVWPVHLPGWLALGWRVAGPSATSAAPLPQSEMAPAVTPESEPTAIEKEPESTAGRRKRGRPRKEEQEQPPVAAEANPAATGAGAEQQTEADSDPAAAVDLATEAAPEPGDDSTADGAVALSALPDDLFSDPLI